MGTGGALLGLNGIPGLPMSQNLLINPGFETADPSGSGYSSVTIPGWTVTGTPTVISYGTLRNYPSPTAHPIPDLPAALGFPQHAPSGGGNNFAGGGPVATSTISQTVNLATSATKIDTGATPYTLSGLLGGYLVDPSAASVQVTFLSAGGAVLGTGTIGPVTALDRLGITGFQQQDVSGTIPAGTRSAVVTATFADHNPVLGNYNDAFADNLSFTVGDPSAIAPTLAPPASNVGSLDHVFVIYIENHGVGDIVGSANAPYINSLINTYGYGDNYYSVGHPSTPNYFRIMGGSDFGIDYNPTGNVINAPSLMQEMDAGHELWAGYAQGMPYAGDIALSDSVGQLPFAQFSSVYNSPTAYLQTHFLPLTQLSTDLQDPSTFPRFAWVAADNANDMEGPVSTPGDYARFIASQLTTHQYNIAPGDQFVQQEVSTIESSTTWTDPTQKDAIFIVSDEDFNNLSLGFGNEGNNVPLIVIPNQGATTYNAVTNPIPMQSGHFVATANYNEYGLMATIEDSLGLAPLTANDTYAQPLNEFWT